VFSGWSNLSDNVCCVGIFSRGSCAIRWRGKIKIINRVNFWNNSGDNSTNVVANGEMF
jgi:hypothetical protein